MVSASFNGTGELELRIEQRRSDSEESSIAVSVSNVDLTATRVNPVVPIVSRLDRRIGIYKLTCSRALALPDRGVNARNIDVCAHLEGVLQFKGA